MAAASGRAAAPLTTQPAPPAPPVATGPGAARAATAGGSGPPTVEEQLFREGYAFDFFQAVRLLERLEPARRPVGREGPAGAEVVRFEAHLSLAFPPSSIYEVERAGPGLAVPRMVVSFMGLTGPSGVLPRHYTELLLRLDREAKGPERRALRAWLDLFNHRLISLFYRAWEKYRFAIPYERGESARGEGDAFTRSLFSLVGLGLPPLRRRLRVSAVEESGGERRERVLARVDDLALLYYGGVLAHRPRCAVSLEALLQDYFGLAARVLQFRGQWLRLEPAGQSRLGEGPCNNELGVSVVAGERVWDVQGKFRVRLGPLGYARFLDFLPDRSPAAGRKEFFLVCHLVRLYAGPEFDFDVQLVLRAEEVPACRLADGDGPGPRLGWNTWVRSQAYPHDADDAAFAGEEVVRVNQDPAAPSSAGPG
jgi:type VI secretion system protein ImpH